jgi:hypothetical protein
MSIPKTVVPGSGQLWLSRPPFLLLVHVLAVDPDYKRVRYEILDRDGSSLSDPVEEALDASWWSSFQPLFRRYG